jgi:nucleoside-diphosphate-sugar epimerase
MKILVTGTEGYLGSLLAPLLIKDGHEVLGVDTGFYREGWLYHGCSQTPRTLNKDIRQITPEDLRGMEAIVHMAELSNDPTGELAPQITHEINHKGSVRLAKLARKSGVTRFVYMSSCSVYGVASTEEVTEESPVNPQTAYAVCKTLVERDLTLLADDNFSPTFLRNATAYGASPRMRFDIVLNNLCGLAWTTREIKLTSDGTPWRPLVHALDIAHAIRHVLAAPRATVHNQVLNIGDTRHNYRIKDIAEVVARVFPNCALSFGRTNPDNRSYRVRFEKVRKVLPGFSCDWDAQKGAEQFYALFRHIDMAPETFTARPFTRLKQLEHLLRTRQIDQDFYWTKEFADLQNGASPTRAPGPGSPDLV